MPTTQIIPIAAIIRGELERSQEPNPVDAIDAVIAAIDPDDYAHYLRELLTARMASESGYLRSRTMRSVRKGVSTKQSLIRDEWWPQFLRQRVSLPGGAKFMADVTVVDLRFLAGVRRGQADDLVFRAEQFESLADLMVRAKAVTLAGLDTRSASKVLVGA